MVYWPTVAWLAFLCALQANFHIHDAFSVADAIQDSAVPAAAAAAAGDTAANFDDVARRGSPSFRLGRRSPSATAAVAPVVGHRLNWATNDDEESRFRRASPSFRLGKRRVSGDGDAEAGIFRVLLPVDGQDEMLVPSPVGQTFEFGDDDAVNDVDDQIMLNARGSPSFRLGKRGPSFRLGKREPVYRVRRGSPSFRLGKRGSDSTFHLDRQSLALPGAQPVVILPYYFRDLSDQDRLEILENDISSVNRPHTDIDDVTSVVDGDDVEQEKRTATFRLGKRDNDHRQSQMTSSSLSTAEGEDNKRSVSFRLG